MSGPFPPSWRARREDALQTSFPHWAATEVDRLMRERQAAQSPAERAQVELQLAVVCDAAQRYGRSLAEVAEL